MKERAVRVSVPPIFCRGCNTGYRSVVRPGSPLLVLFTPADCIANSSKQVRQTLRGLLDCSGRRNFLLVQSLQATIPHFRQWCRLQRYSVSKETGLERLESFTCWRRRIELSCSACRCSPRCQEPRLQRDCPPASFRTSVWALQCTARSEEWNKLITELKRCQPC